MYESYSARLPLLSVVVPVYNVEKYLCQCVDSILGQTLSNMEIILVNDGSADKSGDICDNYSATYRRVRVIHQENKGSILARQAGLDIALGKYVAFVDSDDWIDADLYERLIQPMICDPNIDISISPYIRDRGGECIRLFAPRDPACWSAEEARRYMFKGQWFDWSLCGRIYKRELFEGIQIFAPEHSHGDDAQMNWEILKSPKKVCYQPIPGYHYRDNPISLTHQEKSRERLFYLDRLQYISQDKDVEDKELRRWIAKIACVTGIDYIIDLLLFGDENDNKYVAKYQGIIKTAYSMCRSLLSPPQMRRYHIALTTMIELRETADRNLRGIIAAYHKVHNKKKHIYIYGAGEIGQEVAGILTKHHLEYSGFTVSRADDMDRAKNVASYDEIYKKYPGNCGFIIAMNKENERTVEEKLRKINDIYYMCVGQYSFLY